jgi:hypothetical protein
MVQLRSARFESAAGFMRFDGSVAAATAAFQNAFKFAKQLISEYRIFWRVTYKGLRPGAAQFGSIVLVNGGSYGSIGDSCISRSRDRVIEAGARASDRFRHGDAEKGGQAKACRGSYGLHCSACDQAAAQKEEKAFSGGTEAHCGGSEASLGNAKKSSRRIKKVA